MRYVNIKPSYGVETVDELNPKEFKTNKEFRTELRRLVSEYYIAGMNVYTSQKHDKTWKE